MPNSILTDTEKDVLSRVVPDDIKHRLLSAAQMRFGLDILPVFGETTMSDCYRIDSNRYMLWFNDNHNSTHMVSVVV
jgi:hypothetical protein